MRIKNREKIMKKKFVFALLTLLTGCTGHYYKIPTAPVDTSKYDVVGHGTETATGIMLFSFIPIQQNNKIERATDSLLRTYGGDAVTDVQVRERWFWAWVLNGYKTDVQATILRRRTEAPRVTKK